MNNYPFQSFERVGNDLDAKRLLDPPVTPLDRFLEDVHFEQTKARIEARIDEALDRHDEHAFEQYTTLLVDFLNARL
ncbi:IDEAL domain-containing protein [Planococcaceae bacterium Storch 2/2-2]|nr:IDEAL domain-containing protein [Planococcaceae bacterium Storch 2/2-2]